MTERYWGIHLEPYQKHGTDLLVEQYAQAMRDLAAEEQLELVDLYRALANKPGRLAYFPDGLHTDARGQRIIAELLLEQLWRLAVGN